MFFSAFLHLMSSKTEQIQILTNSKKTIWNTDDDDDDDDTDQIKKLNHQQWKHKNWNH